MAHRELMRCVEGGDEPLMREEEDGHFMERTGLRGSVGVSRTSFFIRQRTYLPRGVSN